MFVDLNKRFRKEEEVAMDLSGKKGKGRRRRERGDKDSNKRSHFFLSP